MKKIDLHVHTISTDLDINFSFEISRLKEYIKTCKIDCIAITNHNVFDNLQFETISNNLDCVVFPGIELSLEHGHCLLITSIDNSFKFSKICEHFENEYKNNGFITEDSLLNSIDNPSEYLLIPHYLKEPCVSKPFLSRFSRLIFCGEVSSPKKFETCIKDDKELVPLVFSDFRSYDLEYNFPTKQSFVDINDIDIKTLKTAIKSRRVSLTDNNVKEEFFVLNGAASASTGLNVILGERSSGKTHTLDSIAMDFESNKIKYIKQFDLITKSEDAIFSKIINRQNDEYKETFLKELKVIVDKCSNIDFDAEKTKIDAYLNSLKEYAANQDKSDIYSRTKLFGENSFDIDDISSLKNMIVGLISLRESDYSCIYEKYIDNESLEKMIVEFIECYEKRKCGQFLKKRANDLIGNVKSLLGKKSSLKPIENINLINLAKSNAVINNFNQLINSIEKEIIIPYKKFNGFQINISIKRILNATELNNELGTKRTANLIKENNPYSFLRELMKNGNDINLDPSLLYKAFWKISFSVVNDFGTSLSGGEKAEYNLLSELQDSYKYDLVLIDEIESSFDNPFINERVISIIRDIAKKSNVFIATHNNNLGVLLKPDMLLYTQKTKDSYGNNVYDIYFNKFGEKKLVTFDGKEMYSYDVLMNTMEASEIAYFERKEIYENTKD